MGKMTKALSNQAYLDGVEDRKKEIPTHKIRWKGTMFMPYYVSGNKLVPCYQNQNVLYEELKGEHDEANL